MSAPSTSTLTEDAIFHGAIRLRQRRGGYRFTEDAVLLAEFAVRTGAVREAADFGAGCGVVGLMLLHVGAAARVVGVELQTSLAALAIHNARANELESAYHLLRADLRDSPIASASLELIVSNPPYRPLRAGQLPADQERAVARHEIACSPVELCREAARCLASGGRLALVYPEARLEGVQSALEGAGLAVCRIRHVHPAPHRPPTQVLIESVRTDEVPHLVIEPPLVTHDEGGERSAEMSRILAGDWGSLASGR